MASLYRLLPSLDKILQSPEIQDALSRHSRRTAVRSARAALARIRTEIGLGSADEAAIQQQLSALPNTIAADMDRSGQFSLQRVINATGVILHTNLGRAPLSRSALDHVCEVAGEYSNLEFDLESGNRSRRDVHAESLVLRALAMKAGLQHTHERGYGVLVANNCAAATFLVLNSLAEGREVIVSRGELVEIGGGFRIPEILRKSGAILREVGTTNRTRLADYQAALSDRTALILRVHQSNFHIQGFAERPPLEALAAMATKSRVPLFEDQGTGLMDPMNTSSSDADASFVSSFKEHPEILTASGDKLLGGPQCGIIVGKQDLIRIVAKNPLMRAFRVCKLTYAALAGTLMDYLTENEKSIPVLRMLALSAEEIFGRCERLVSSLPPGDLKLEVVPSKGLIGGGTTPGKKLNSFAVAVHHPSISSEQLARLLRKSTPPLISRIQKDRILLDLRTVLPESDSLIAQILSLVDAAPNTPTEEFES